LTFEIKKRTSGTRLISSPNATLKDVQQKLNTVLQKIYHPKHCVKGFVLNRSIVDNASVHVKTKFILNIDIKDFFGSINFGRVRGLFLSKPFNFTSEVATVLAQICCHNNALPQGAPTSPVISNMICSRLDGELQRLAKQYCFYYTRYADDITFSKTVPFPKEIVDKKPSGELIIGPQLLKIFTDNGFELNSSKSRLLEQFNRQVVTGLVVNRKVNVRREYIRQIRAMIHAWETYGLDKAQEEFFNKYDRRTRNPLQKKPNFSWIVKGKLEFLGQVRGKNDKIYLNLRSKIKSLAPELFKTPVGELEKLYQEFLDLENIKTTKANLKRKTQKRGYDLQTFFFKLFTYFEIPVTQSFTRNSNGEQIDGGFEFNFTPFIVECKWKTKLSGIEEIGSFNDKVSRSGKLTMGCFISIKGWSSKVIPLLKQNPNKAIILIDGEDLKFVLQNKISLTVLLSKKIDKLNYASEPYFPVSLMVKS
jgi:RNA-directed DNA polymerase